MFHSICKLAHENIAKDGARGRKTVVEHKELQAKAADLVLPYQNLAKYR